LPQAFAVPFFVTVARGMVALELAAAPILAAYFFFFPQLARFGLSRLGSRVDQNTA